MTDSNDPVTHREHLLYERLAACLEAEDHVRESARGQILEGFPEFTSELQDFFAGEMELDRLTAPLRNPPQHETPSQGVAETVVLPARPSLPDYEVFEEIARGGMGVVYRARHKTLRRIVALKMIRSGELASEDELRRFEREAHRVARLDHPHIVPLYDVGTHAGQHYFTMRLMEGGTLAARIAGGCLSLRESASIVSQISRALHHAHQHGILHRDVKPGNILFDSQIRPQIADFGLAKQLEHAGASAPAHAGSAEATSSRAIAGTPMYMAPEQVRRDESLSTAADIYSLGAVLYELLTGEPPFRAATTYQTLVDVVQREPRRPKLLNVRIDRDLETICLCCLEKRPDRRYRSADALADDLDRWLRGEPILARACPPWSRAAKWARRSPAWAALVAVATAAIIFCGAALLISNVRVNSERANTQRALDARTDALEELSQTRSREQRLSYLQSIALADRELSAGPADRAEAVLNECPPPLRGWEWHYLKRRCHAELSSAAIRFEPRCVAADPISGTLFVGGGALAATGRIAAFDADLKRLYEIEAHDQTVTALAAGRNGGLAASGSRDGGVRIWRAATTEELTPLKALEGQNGPVWSLSLSPDATRLASAGADGVIRVWNTDSGELLQTLSEHQGAVWHVTFHPDGRRLASAGNDHIVRLWDLQSGGAIHVLTGHRGLVRHVAFSEDGQWLASASDDSTVRVWSVDGEERNRLTHPSYVTRANFSPDGRRIVTASVDGNIRLWDIDREQVAETLHGHDGAIWDLSLSTSTSGERLASIGEDGSIKTWPAASGRQLPGLGHERWLTSLKSSRRGEVLVGLCSDETLQIWDANGEAMQSVDARLRDSDAFCVSANGECLATAEWSKVKVLGLGRDPITSEVQIEAGNTVAAVALNQDGSRMAVATADRHVAVWNTRTKRKVGEFPLLNRVTAISLDASSDQLAAVERVDGVDAIENTPGPATEASSGYRVSVWHVASGRQIAGFSTDNDQVIWTADGDRLCTYGNSRMAKVWSIASREMEATMHDTHAEIVATACDFEAGRIFAGHADGTITLWDFATQRRILTLRGHDAAVVGLARGKDGRLASVDANGVRMTWDGAPFQGNTGSSLSPQSSFKEQSNGSG